MANKSKIEIHFLSDPFSIDGKKVKLWISETLKKFEKTSGEINIIFCSDDYLLDLNKKYLSHDYYTDIITFPYEGDSISGDLYISVDRVKENAQSYKVDFDIEILRVIIHGIFHLLGYRDKTKKEKENIRSLEDQAIETYKKNYSTRSNYYDQVYDVVRCIPKGKICTYGIIADFLTLGSARMVGYALNHLKGSQTDIPAHRVVNAKGELSGRLYFGGENIMANLLIKEGVEVKNDRIQNFEKFVWNPANG